MSSDADAEGAADLVDVWHQVDQEEAVVLSDADGEDAVDVADVWDQVNQEVALVLSEAAGGAVEPSGALPWPVGGWDQIDQDMAVALSDAGSKSSAVFAVGCALHNLFIEFPAEDL